MYYLVGEVLIVAGNYSNGTNAGVWYRGGYNWGGGDSSCGFRAAGYAS